MSKISRRDFMQLSSTGAIASLLPAVNEFGDSHHTSKNIIANESGGQRLSLEKLKAWEDLGYGMFIHFGMSTFDEDEYSRGDKSASLYNPDKLDVNQWVSVARDAGMKYAVLTAKHVAGHCLWPTRYTDYHVGNSGNKTDVVEAFTKACSSKGIMSGLYYCAWDNHNLFGSGTPTNLTWATAYTTTEYREFQWKQLEELLTQYGPIGEVWLDIPQFLTRDYRQKLYNQIAKWQPDAIILFNHGRGDGSEFSINVAWPTDVITIERFVPNSATAHVKWREIENKRYYMPGEVCDPIGKEWFYKEQDFVRSDAELLGMYLICRSRGANLLLDVPPDKHGLIPQKFIDALQRLKQNINKHGFIF
jgi:alpha-L-fucosidase